MLTPHEQELLISVLQQHTGISEAKLFGSRAKGTARPESDIDIALYGSWSPLDAQAVAEHLDELPLPYTYDVKPAALIHNAALVEHIDRVGITIYRR